MDSGGTLYIKNKIKSALENKNFTKRQTMAKFIKEIFNDFRLECGLPVFGKKHFEIAKAFVPSVGTFTTAAAIFTVYLTDWKVIVGNLPFYNTKFKEED